MSDTNLLSPDNDSQKSTEFAALKTNGSSASTSTDASATPPPFEFPFDPWRIVAAMRRKMMIIFAAGAVVAIVAAAVGWKTIKTAYVASGLLLRQDLPNSFRALEGGEPFKPREMSVATLVSLMKSPPLLMAAGSKCNPPVKQSVLSDNIIITPERNTDLIKISYRSTENPELALTILNIYGSEVITMTRDLQAQEAGDVNKFLKQQLAKADEEFRQANNELLSYAKETKLVSAEKEIDAFLSKLGSIDLKFETARLDFETLDIKLAGLERELTAHSPVADRLQVAREQLETMLNHYTTNNPMVDEQKARIASLEKVLKSQEGKVPDPPRAGESGVAASLYLEYIAAKSQKEVLKQQMEKLYTLRTNLQAQLQLLPEKAMQYARMKAKQQSLETAQTLLAARQREAQIFEEGVLSYYRFFEGKKEDVIKETSERKVLIIAGIALLAGMLLAGLFFGLVEIMDPHTKTAADVRRIAKLPVLFSLGNINKISPDLQAQWAFRTWTMLEGALTKVTEPAIVCGFIGSRSGQGCSTIVRLLGQAASLRDVKIIVVTNNPPADIGDGNVVPIVSALNNPENLTVRRSEPCWISVPEDWRWTAEYRSQWVIASQAWIANDVKVILVELSSPHSPDTLLLGESIPQLIWVVRSGSPKAAELSEQLEIYRNAHCKVIGAALNVEPNYSASK